MSRSPKPRHNYRGRFGPGDGGFIMRPNLKGKIMQKFFLNSKTLWGIVMMILPTVFQFFGWQWDAANAGDIEKAFGYGVELVGAILAVYGRVVATKPLSATPK